jgi:succinate dehydrogenase / fumarate reductase cytochrome b subunit
MSDAIVSIEKTKAPRKDVLTTQVRWGFRRPMNLEKLALLAQRVSGVGILAYLFLHIFITGTIVGGPDGVPGGQDVFSGLMGMLFNPIAHIGELLVVVGATFHGINGIRVMLLEVTKLIGHPIRPDYPYKTQSLGKGQQSILLTAMIMAGLATIAGIFILFLEAGA